MQDRSDCFSHARERVRAALAAMGSGIQTLTSIAGRRPTTPPFSGRGVRLSGVTRALPRRSIGVGTRFKGGALVPEDIVSFESGDLAYTVGFERGEVVVDGGTPAPLTIRVTHIYRRIDGEWYLIHRHADFPPADQRQLSDRS